MKRTIAIAVIVLAMVTGVTANIAIAQETNNSTVTENATEVSNNEYEDMVTEVSSTTTLTRYKFDTKNETVTLWFDAAIKERVTLTDAYIDAGKEVQDVNQQKPYINGKQKITFSVSKIDGKMGVTIGAGGNLKAITWEKPGFTFSSTYSAPQMIVGMVTATALGIILVLVIAYKRQIEYNSRIKQVW